MDNTTDVLFERWFYCENLGTQLVPVIKEYVICIFLKDIFAFLMFAQTYELHLCMSGSWIPNRIKQEGLTQVDAFLHVCLSLFSDS